MHDGRQHRRNNRGGRRQRHNGPRSQTCVVGSDRAKYDADAKIPKTTIVVTRDDTPIVLPALFGTVVIESHSLTNIAFIVGVHLSNFRMRQRARYASQLRNPTRKNCCRLLQGSRLRS
jgi:hypothetical protein